VTVICSSGVVSPSGCSTCWCTCTTRSAVCASSLTDFWPAARSAAPMTRSPERAQASHCRGVGSGSGRAEAACAIGPVRRSEIACNASQGACWSAGLQVWAPTITATATSSAVVIGSICSWASVPGSSLLESISAAATAATTTASTTAPVTATVVVLIACPFLAAHAAANFSASCGTISTYVWVSAYGGTPPYCCTAPGPAL